MAGSIPKSINDLVYLGVIDFRDNSLSGTIPATLNELEALQVLNLSKNDFTGTIPSTLTKCVNMTTIVLNSNKLIGTLPPGLLQMTLLSLLDLGSNTLNGTLPQFSSTSLYHLNIGANSFSGVISDSICDSSYLETIDLHDNNFSGSLPPAISEMNSLKSLNAGDNLLSGYLATFFRQELEYLSLENNLFVGTIPEFYTNSSVLRTLNLAHNHLNGSIPLLNSSSLISLDLSQNFLAGVLSLHNLENIEYINLSQNNITGTLHIPDLARLTYINMSYNWLFGDTPFDTAPCNVTCDLSYNCLLCNSSKEVCGCAMQRYPPSSCTCLNNASCLIDGTCYSNGTFKSGQMCEQACVPSANPFGWVLPSDGFPCADGIACTYEDGCQAGTCQGSPYCVDDGLLCTDETCLENGTCGTSISPGWCDISGVCYTTSTPNPTDSCLMCNSSISTNSWVPVLTCVDTSNYSEENEYLKIFAIIVLVVAIITIIATVACIISCRLFRQSTSLSRQLWASQNRESVLRLSYIDQSLDLSSCNAGLPEGFDFQITPKGNLSFQLNGHQAPVAVELTDTIVMGINPTGKLKRQPLYFKLLTPSSCKYSLTFEPQFGQLLPGEQVKILVTLMIFCTTTVDTSILVSLDSEKSVSSRSATLHAEGMQSRVLVPVKVSLKSMLSTSIDYDELELGAEPIGEGTYGIVYKASWRGQEVAVKVVKNQTGFSTQEFLAKEIRILETIRCPQIVNFIGAVKIPGKLSIVMEFFPLGSLTTCMKTHSFSSTLKIKCLLDTARGMRFLHHSAILHRDLKSDNILMSSLDPEAQVNCKISDFGATRDVNTSKVPTQCYTIIGTPVFMSPEVLMNGKYDASADVFSFSILCYQVLTGKEPYSDFGTIFKISQFVIAGNRLPLTGLVSPPLEKLVSGCWAQEPLSRPSFDSICETLEELLLNNTPVTVAESLC
ncbi:tyrosine protein kinase [Pelomyxa schiedti]|nr:tyrosine protein kinase [Pelomyxa schiedti]